METISDGVVSSVRDKYIEERLLNEGRLVANNPKLDLKGAQEAISQKAVEKANSDLLPLTSKRIGLELDVQTKRSAAERLATEVNIPYNTANAELKKQYNEALIELTKSE